tara:strand:+ start:9209 stop:11395 length:2187 start_codon:yes stop_codon:yes gene_type:complete
MAVNYSTVSDKVFKVIKGSGHEVKMYDSTTGDETVDPSKSRYFYVKNPNFMVNIDEETGEIKFHEGSNDNVATNLKSIINNIKHLAKGYMLDFDHRQFGKELKPKNYAWRVEQNKGTQMADVTTEGYTPLQGSTKTSEQKLEGVKVIVRHNKAVDETSRGARSRNIQGIFVETSEGERFKYPHIHLNGARAMARHVHAGGKPHDEVGEAIVELSDTLAKLKEVTKYARRFSQVQEQAADILPLVDSKIASVKNQIHKLTTASGYTSFVEGYKKAESKEHSIESLEDLKTKFTVTKFDEKIGEVLPLLQSIMDEAKAEQDNSTEAMMQRIAQKLKTGEPVELMAPAKDEYAIDKVGSFKDNASAISYKLADMAGKIKDDEMSVFLSRLSDKVGHMHRSKYEPQPTRQEMELAKQIVSLSKMKDVTPNEDLVPDTVKELEESVEDFGTDASFIEADPAVKRDDTVDRAVKNVMSYVGKDVNPKMSYHNWLKKVKGIERGARGISGNQHAEFSKEFRAYKGESANEDGITQADLDSERFAELHDYEEYKDAVLDDIKTNPHYAKMSREQVIADLRKEADSIGYADVSDGDRRPEEPTWLTKIADELESERQEPSLNDLVKQDAESKDEDTTEASGYEGQNEAHAHQVSFDGDWDQDRGISDKDCKEVEFALAKVGIKSQCEPDEMRQGGVIIHTMADRDATVDALDKAGMNLDETSEESEEVNRIKDLAGL